MHSSWISIVLFFILFASTCKGQAPKYSGATHSSSNDRITDTRSTRLTLKREPVYQAPNQRSIFIKKIDELHTDLDEQKTVFVTHKRDFDDHIYSFERRLVVLTHDMQEMSNKIQVLLKKNLELENQLKKINEQFVLIPNKTDSTTEILELKDRKKRENDLEKKSDMKNVDNDLMEEQTNMIVEARGVGKRNVLSDPRSVSDARKSLFSVARKTPLYGSDNGFRTINFNHIFVNKGKHFVNDNTFVCQLNGFYFFTFTVRSLALHTTYVALMKNTEVQTSISADSSKRSIMQSQSTILQMSSGDEVWLRVGPNSDFGLDSDESHKYITFSGFLIYEESQ